MNILIAISIIGLTGLIGFFVWLEVSTKLAKVSSYHIMCRASDQAQMYIVNQFPNGDFTDETEINPKYVWLNRFTDVTRLDRYMLKWAKICVVKMEGVGVVNYRIEMRMVGATPKLIEQSNSQQHALFMARLIEHQLNFLINDGWELNRTVVRQFKLAHRSPLL